MTPTLVTTVDAFRAACDAVRARGGSVGLVPTMGALHVGHIRLFQAAKTHATDVAVTIFVNPTQFGPSEDFARYPRDLEGDLEKCRTAGAALVFAPSTEQIYPQGELTRVHVNGLTEHLCGPFRPGHFEGVATVVAKLLSATGPCTAVFGRKDYQQLKVIERMVRDLLMPVRIVEHPTVRESDGMALSSRNAYLSAEQRRAATAIPVGLTQACAAFASGQRSPAALSEPIVRQLEEAGLEVEYVTVADRESLVPFAGSTLLDGPALCAVAARIGRTRLIDNVVLGEDPPPIPGGTA
jgi:pantoate--beta-alanine ligase